MINFRILLSVCFLLNVRTTLAQEPFTIGAKHQLYSDSLKENREFYIYLPPDYNDTRYPAERFPVIYLLDAESNFHSFTGLQQTLSRGAYRYMPPGNRGRSY